MAMPEEQARKLADQTDKILAKLDNEQARALVKELRLGRDAILARLALLTDEDLTWESHRLQDLMRHIDITIADLGRRMQNVVLLYPERAAAVADKYAGDIMQVRITGSFGVLNRPALVALQTYNFDLIKNVCDDLRGQVRSVITQGVIQGHGIPQISRQLVGGTPLQQGTFPKVEKRAVVIARTETIRAFTQGVTWQFQQHGITRVQWMTARDDRVCTWCGPLDGKIFPLNQLPGGGPPIHPQCRCFLRPVIATTEEEGKVLDLQARANAKREQERFSKRKKAA